MAENSDCFSMVEAEVSALKEALWVQHQVLENLFFELEKEREASATAASEALSMILRLQEEKAAEKMEACQYKRITEEKMRHVEESLVVFEDIMYRKEMEIASLEFQVQAYRHKLLSTGFSDLPIGEMRFLENLFCCEGDVYLDNMTVHGTVRRNPSLPVRRSKSLNLVKWGIERKPSLVLGPKSDQDMACEFDVECENRSNVHLGQNYNHKNCGVAHEMMQNVHKESAIEGCYSDLEESEQMGEEMKDSSFHVMSIDEENQSEMMLRSMSCPQHSIASGSPFLDSIDGSVGTKLARKATISCSCSKAGNQLNLRELDVNMECEGNRNSIHSMSVHDIFEVPQCLKDYKLLKPQKEATQMLKKASKHTPSPNEFCAQENGITVDCDHDHVDPRNEVSLSQAESRQLNKRLELLEDNSRIMKQDASDRWNEELKMLTKISEQLKLIESQITNSNLENSLTDHSSVVSIMEAMWYYAL